MYDVCEQISVVERQVFDFFGFMWTCIIINFIQIILVIAGLFGVCQGRAKIVVAVSIWDTVCVLCCFFVDKFLTAMKNELCHTFKILMHLHITWLSWDTCPRFGILTLTSISHNYKFLNIKFQLLLNNICALKLITASDSKVNNPHSLWVLCFCCRWYVTNITE